MPEVTNMKPRSNKSLPLTPEEKKKIKEEKRQRDHMNSMVSRGEVHEALQKLFDALMEDRKRIEITFIQLQTLIDVLVEKQLTTPEDLDTRSIPYVEKLYGSPGVNPIKEEKDGQGQETQDQQQS